MAPASKRAKTTSTSTMAAQPQLFIPFQTGPSLERIPDDVLHEILSHLPTLTDRHVLFGHQIRPTVIPSTSLVRTPTLRALSQTSRLLRSRCLAMAWRSVELCGANIPEQIVTFYKVIGEATKTATRVLKACPHLLPLIQTVTVALTRYHATEITSALAACLATLPNLTTIQVLRANPQIMTTIKNEFESKQFPSMRKISIPCSAHGIIKSCPNVEEVICTDGGNTTLVGSLVKRKCQQVHTLKGICTIYLPRLFGLHCNLKYVSVYLPVWDMTPLASFPFLDTIEIVQIGYDFMQDMSPSEITALDVKKASEILKENKSKAEKTVIVTIWNTALKSENFDFDPNRSMIREVIRVKA